MEVNNREWAIAFWAVAALLAVVLIPAARRLAAPLLEAVRTRHVLVPFAIMVGYVGAIVACAWHTQLWNLSLATPTIVWFITVAVVSFFQLNRAMKEKHYFRMVLLEAVSLPLAVQFLVDLYPFSLPIEIVLQGALLVLGGLLGIAMTKHEFHSIKRLLEFALYGTGLVIAANSVSQMVTNWSRIDFASEGAKFALPIAMTILLLPFLYALSLYAAYQSAAKHMQAVRPPGSSLAWPVVALVARTTFSVKKIADVTPRTRMRMAETSTWRAALAAFDEGRALEDARQQAKQERQQRLIDNAGLSGADDDGKRLDQREFEETMSALSYLHMCQAGHHRNGGRYRLDLLDLIGSDTFAQKGLPEGAQLAMAVEDDGQQWWAWRRTITGWVFAIGAKEAPNDRWEYEGPDVPAGGPGDDPRWRHFMVPAAPHHHW